MPYFGVEGAPLPLRDCFVKIKTYSKHEYAPPLISFSNNVNTIIWKDDKKGNPAS
jgi:hypothetical protein